MYRRVAMNIGVHVSFWIMFFSEYMPRSRIAGSYGSSIFFFKGTYIVFSIVAVPIYMPINKVEGIPYLHPLWIFNGSCSDWCKVVCHCSFLHPLYVEYKEK